MQLSHVRIRARRRHHKSTNGCNACRRKHLKCDERKPACLRCILAAADCKYGTPRIRLFPAASVLPVAGNAQPVQPSSAYRDPSERRALLWFTEKLLPGITGFTAQTGTFWRSLLPRLSETEPSIRHILIAIASKHEGLRELSPRGAELTPVCARHHSLALQHLMRSDIRVKSDVLLVSCVALSFFERMRDPFAMEGRCSDFVSAGLKILRERRTNPRATGDGDGSTLISDFLEPMFFQMELMLSMFAKPDYLVYPDLEKMHSSQLKIPAAFTDLRAARHAFFQIISRRYNAIYSGLEWTQSSVAFQEIRMLLAKWLTALDAYLAMLCSKDTAEYDRAYFLREQTCLLIGGLLYCARAEVPIKCFCHPIIANFSSPLRLSITIQIHGKTKVNLSGVNTGTPAKIKDPELSLWPHARCVKGQNNENLVLLELNRH